MTKLIALIAVITATIAIAQTCIVPAPPTPPVPTQAIIYLPVDGGGQGCLVQAVVQGGEVHNMYAISNAKCAAVVAFAKQAAAIDNGWDDGGVP